MDSPSQFLLPCMGMASYGHLSIHLSQLLHGTLSDDPLQVPPSDFSQRTWLVRFSRPNSKPCLTGSMLVPVNPCLWHKPWDPMLWSLALECHGLVLAVRDCDCGKNSVSWIPLSSRKFSFHKGPFKGTKAYSNGKTLISTGATAPSSKFSVEECPLKLLKSLMKKMGLFTVVQLFHVLWIKSQEALWNHEVSRFAFQRMMALDTRSIHIGRPSTGRGFQTSLLVESKCPSHETFYSLLAVYIFFIPAE